jgi:hypothetical protein
LTGAVYGVTVAVTPLADEGRCFIGESPHAGDGSRAQARWSLDAARRAVLTGIAVGALAMVFGAARAEAVPSVTFECTPAPADCSGWYRSNVSIEWTVLPSSATVVAGCVDETLTTDVREILKYCSARDGSTVSVEVPIKIDKTPPAVLSGSPARGADLNGWYNHPVAIAFSGSDATSGIDFCTTQTYAGPDSGAASLSGTCADKAGNVSSPLGYGIKYDQTGPDVASANPERASNSAGWFNRAVRFDLQASDATSGIADCPPVTYNGPDSATASFTGTCRDHAGNLSSRSFGLKYDSTAPSGVSGQARRGPDRNGWYNAPVSIDFSGSDHVSGVQGCTTTTYGGPDTLAVSVPGTCTDRAGNISGASTVGLKYDGTAPMSSGGSPGRGADVNGWYNRPVAVTFSGSDLMSGIDACSALTYSGPDSGAASLSGTCTDRAGNVSHPLGYGLRYDATAPAMGSAIPERAPNADGWFNRSVRLDIQGTDPTSGIADCPDVTYSGPDSGTASFIGTCHDRAGNSASRSYGLKYDQTAPEATTATPERAANGFGWYSGPVSVAFTGRDGTSGVQACTHMTYAGPDNSTASVPGTCTDRAGNVSAPLGFALRYDATAPAVERGDPGRLPNANGWYNAPVSIGFIGRDGLSGVDACTSGTYSGPDNAAASVAGTCRDRAGNVSAPLGFGLKYDSTAPAIDRGQLGRPADANGWYNRPVSIDFSGTDGLSGLDGCTSVTYNAPDSATASVTGRCADKAGNQSGPLSVGFKYDATAPVVTGATAERAPEPNGWYTRPVTFDIQGTDATSGIAECPSMTYSAPDGPDAAVVGQCRDNAGNVSSRPFDLMFDATAPAIMDLTATPGDRRVALSWRTTPDAELVGVKRTPGAGLGGAILVFDGPGSSFVDGQVDNGVQYVYEVNVRDPAGNGRSETVTAVPAAPPAPIAVEAAAAPGPGVGPTDVTPTPAPSTGGRRVHLLAPPAGAVIRPGRRPLLRWTPVPGADYYNLQLFRDGKLLTTWPTEPRYRLKLRWRYRGERQRLLPGEYHWIVWPGFGPRSKADYGRRIGRRTFEIRARR